MPSDAIARPVAAPIDLEAIAAAVGCSLPGAFVALQALYDDVDARNARNTAQLNLPCHRGCSMCCHESVFITGLEFFYAWDYAQRTLPQATRDDIVQRGVDLYRRHQQSIDALDRPPPDGEADHLSIARTIRFACPMLDQQGGCRVYPARELLARLFGSSFYDDGAVYGCHLVGAHLADKTVTLMRARATARRLDDLPLTEKRQVYPYWLNLLYGAQVADSSAAANL